MLTDNCLMAAIIFDFDGTIADSFDHVTTYLMKSAGMPKPSREDLEPYRFMSMLAIARSLGISWWKMPRLLIEGRRYMEKVGGRIEPFEDMPEIIRKAQAQGHELFIVSSNSIHTLHKFLHKYKLHTYFLQIYGGISLFGKAKALRGLLKDQNLEVKNCVYIGDELRDIEASKSIGMKVIAVSWGFARTEDLKKHHPTALVTTPHDLLMKIEEL